MLAYLGNNIDPWSISSQLFAWLKMTLASSSYDKQEQFAGWKMERGIIVLIELDEHLSHLCCTAEYTVPNYNLDDVIMAVHSECYAFGPIECQERPLKILTKS